MALAEVQAALARLFTDAALRDAFFADDPEAAARRCGLDKADARALARLSRPDVERFAATLLRKRVAGVRAALPLTARALGPAAFATLAAPVLTGPARPGRHRDDARAVAQHLADLMRSQGVTPSWAADLARWEAAAGDAGRRRCCLVCRRFRYPVADLAAAILSGAVPVAVTPRTTVSVFVRWPGQRGPLHRSWPPARWRNPPRS